MNIFTVLREGRWRMRHRPPSLAFGSTAKPASISDFSQEMFDKWLTDERGFMQVSDLLRTLTANKFTLEMIALKLGSGVSPALLSAWINGDDEFGQFDWSRHWPALQQMHRWVTADRVLDVIASTPAQSERPAISQSNGAASIVA